LPQLLVGGGELVARPGLVHRQASRDRRGALPKQVEVVVEAGALVALEVQTLVDRDDAALMADLDLELGCPDRHVGTG
jgi:hypothetical protein